MPDGLLCTPRAQALTCQAGEVIAQDDCAARQETCFAPLGCMRCAPGSTVCEGNQRKVCKEDGSEYELREICEAPRSCSSFGCEDLCERARRERSYIGCEYFPVFTMNSALDTSFQPAVVVANPNLVPAEINVTRVGTTTAHAIVQPGQVATISLPFVPELRTASAPELGVVQSSLLVRGGAYHLVSSVPVTVHQFNPLLFETDRDCDAEEGTLQPGKKGDGKCNSYSNDASLLIPADALTRDPGRTLTYVASSFPATITARDPSVGPWLTSPGVVTIVGASSEPVSVIVRASSYTRGAEVVSGPAQQGSAESVPALQPGEPTQFSLARGDVLQLLSSTPVDCGGAEVRTQSGSVYTCPLGAAHDLTGTIIEADGPVQVIGGHDCAFVPFDRVACDHLEESMFPVDTWGREVVVPRVREGLSQPQVIRVLSAEDDNLVEFEPPVHAPVTLQRAAVFELQAEDSLIVRGEKAISVSHFMIGQGGTGRVGDPSLSMAIPVEQYRRSYAFLSPATYRLNYVTVIARPGDSVSLDGQAVTNFTLVGGGSYQVATVSLLKAGAHHIESQLGSGIVLYGFGDYTSYMLPGGLDLRVLTLF